MVPDIALSLPEAEARIAQLEDQRAWLRAELFRTRSDMADVVEQIEPLDMCAWAQIKYAVDNGLPIPEVKRQPARGRRQTDLQVEMLDEDPMSSAALRFITKCGVFFIWGFFMFGIGVAVGRG